LDGAGFTFIPGSIFLAALVLSFTAEFVFFAAGFIFSPASSSHFSFYASLQTASQR
jgi:hypothetical protein